MSIDQLAGIGISFAFGALLIWMILRARKGYASVQSLMAQVEAHASAEAQANAAATNTVAVTVGQGQLELTHDELTEIARYRKNQELARLYEVPDLSDLQGEYDRLETEA